MPTHKQVHNFKAASATPWVDPAHPKVAQVNFMMVESGDFVSVEIPRHVLVRLIGTAQRMLRDVPLNSRVRSGPSRSATSANK